MLGRPARPQTLTLAHPLGCRATLGSFGLERPVGTFAVDMHARRLVSMRPSQAPGWSGAVWQDVTPLRPGSTFVFNFPKGRALWDVPLCGTASPSFFSGVMGRSGVRSRQSDHINAFMNREGYTAVQSGFLKAGLGGTASVRWGGVSCAMVRGGALQCGAVLWLLHDDGDGNVARSCLLCPSGLQGTASPTRRVVPQRSTWPWQEVNHNTPIYKRAVKVETRTQAHRPRKITTRTANRAQPKRERVIWMRVQLS